MFEIFGDKNQIKKTLKKENKKKKLENKIAYQEFGTAVNIQQKKEKGLLHENVRIQASNQL